MQTFLCKPFQHKQNHCSRTIITLCALSPDRFASRYFLILLSALSSQSWTQGLLDLVQSLRSYGLVVLIADTWLAETALSLNNLSLRLEIQSKCSSAKNVVKLPCDTEKKCMQNSVTKKLTSGYQSRCMFLCGKEAAWWSLVVFCALRSVAALDATVWINWRRGQAAVDLGF